MSTTLVFGQREWDLVYRVALQVLKAPDQAEDVAQDALLLAYRARHRFAGRAKPDSWLYRIARNTALTYLRRPFSKRYADTDVQRAFEQQSEAGAKPETPESRARASRLAERLDDYLSRLCEPDRVAFTERFLLGTSERELGQILGVSTNAAKQRAFRVRRTIRSRFHAVGISP